MHKIEKWSNIIAKSCGVQPPGVFSDKMRSYVRCWHPNQVWFFWLVVSCLRVAQLYVFVHYQRFSRIPSCFTIWAKRIPEPPLTTVRFLKYVQPFFNIMYERVSMCYKGTFNQTCQPSMAKLFFEKTVKGLEKLLFSQKSSIIDV